MRQNFPGRIKKQRPGGRADSGRRGLRAQPSLQILLKTFLGLEIFRDNDEGTLRELLMDQRRQKRAGGGGNPGK